MSAHDLTPVSTVLLLQRLISRVSFCRNHRIRLTYYSSQRSPSPKWSRFRCLRASAGASIASSLISRDCAKTAKGPLFLTHVEQYAIYLTGLAIVVLARFVACHLPRQGPLRDAINEDSWQQGDCGWIPTTSGAPGLYLSKVPVEVCRRTVPLAVADGTGRMNGLLPTYILRHWVFRALVDGRGGA